MAEDINPQAARHSARAEIIGIGPRETGLLEHFLHRLAGAEAHDLPAGNHDDLIGLVRIAADPLAPFAHVENAEFAEFDRLPGAQGIHDGIQGLLDHRDDLLLGQARFLGDSDRQVAFGQVLHFVFHRILAFPAGHTAPFNKWNISPSAQLRQGKHKGKQ